MGEDKKKLKCPMCGKWMIRRKSNWGNNFWWGCPNYPKCKVKANEHPNGELMSYPAGEITRELRINAHMLCDSIWGSTRDSQEAKARTYRWLKKNTPTGHIGKLNDSQLCILIGKLLKEKRKKECR